MLNRLRNQIAGELFDFHSWSEAGTEEIRQKLRDQLAAQNADYDQRQGQWQVSQEELRQQLPSNVQRKARYICLEPDGSLSALVDGRQHRYLNGREVE